MYPFAAANHVLSPADTAYLKDRALRFAQEVSLSLASTPVVSGHPFGILRVADGRRLVAMLASVARFGDDHNYSTGVQSPEWNPAKANAAFVFVRDNVFNWATDLGLLGPQPLQG